MRWVFRAVQVVKCVDRNEAQTHKPNWKRKKTIEQDVPNKWQQMYDQTKFKPKLKQTAHHAYLLPKTNVSKIYGIQFSKWTNWAAEKTVH